MTIAKITKYLPPSRSQPSGRVEVECPYCTLRDRYRRPTDIPGHHIHGLGHAGQQPVAGHRSAHCTEILGRGYEVVDSDGLLPEVLEIVQAATS